MTPTSKQNDYDGVLLLDKPAGPSSNRAMQRVKSLLAARKAGHAGTLDPLATGLLPILLGEATKFAGALAEAGKIYRATVLLGTITSTGDVSGAVLSQRPVRVSEPDIRDAAQRFVGEIQQIPHMYSALKHRGRALYQLARAGQIVERQPRTVSIDEIRLVEVRGDEFDICVSCSKGTYIRVLAEDLGAALGCGATLKALRRVAVSGFRVDAALTLDALECLGADWARIHILPPDVALEGMAPVWLDRGQRGRIGNGQPIATENADEQACVRLYDRERGNFVGIGKVAAGWIRPERLVSGLSSRPASELPFANDAYAGSESPRTARGERPKCA